MWGAGSKNLDSPENKNYKAGQAIHERVKQLTKNRIWSEGGLEWAKRSARASSKVSFSFWRTSANLFSLVLLFYFICICICYVVLSSEICIVKIHGNLSNQISSFSLCNMLLLLHPLILHSSPFCFFFYYLLAFSMNLFAVILYSCDLILGFKADLHCLFFFLFCFKTIGSDFNMLIWLLLFIIMCLHFAVFFLWKSLASHVEMFIPL